MGKDVKLFNVQINMRLKINHRRYANKKLIQKDMVQQLQ